MRYALANCLSFERSIQPQSFCIRIGVYITKERQRPVYCNLDSFNTSMPVNRTTWDMLHENQVEATVCLPFDSRVLASNIVHHWALTSLSWSRILRLMFLVPSSSVIALNLSVATRVSLRLLSLYRCARCHLLTLQLSSKSVAWPN